jgi:transposase
MPLEPEATSSVCTLLFFGPGLVFACHESGLFSVARFFKWPPGFVRQSGVERFP